MEEAERRIRRETPPEGSRVDTLRRFFDGDPGSRGKIDLDTEASRSSEGSSPATRHHRKGKENTPERPRRSAEKHPHDATCLSPAAMGMDGTAAIATSGRAAKWERPEPVVGEATTPL